MELKEKNNGVLVSTIAPSLSRSSPRLIWRKYLQAQGLRENEEAAKAQLRGLAEKKETQRK